MDFEIFQIAQNVEELTLDESQIDGLLETAAEMYEDLNGQSQFSQVSEKLEETIYWLKIRRDNIQRKKNKPLN